MSTEMETAAGWMPGPTQEAGIFVESDVEGRHTVDLETNLPLKLSDRGVPHKRPCG